MPLFIALLMRGLLWAAGSIVGRVLVRLGIGVATYSGMNATLGWLKTQAVTALQGMPADIVNLMSYMKVGVAISIVCSAIVARAVLNGVTGDKVKRWAIK